MNLNYRFLITAVIIIILDQLTKIIIKSKLAIGETKQLFSFFSLTHTTNTGAGFGILQNQNVILMVVSIVVLIVIIFHYKSYKEPLLSYSAGLVFAGGLGNLIDRIIQGSVTDFISIGWWPTFNIADSAITIGVILLVIYFWKKQ